METQAVDVLAFSSNLWDQLPKIQIYNKKGAQMLQSLKHFASSYNQIVHSFSKNLRQCAQTLENEFLSTKSFKQTDSEGDDEYTTLTIAITSVKSGLDSLASIINDSTHTVVGDLIEPLDTYTRTYQHDSNESFACANPVWANYYESSIAVRNAKQKFFDLKDQAERQEVKIEEALLAHDRGSITIQKVQKISQKGVQIKYQAELASQNYSRSVAQYNQVVASMPNTYCSHLQKVQQLEESRINFLKSGLEKMVKQLGVFGAKISQQSAKLLEQSQFINPDSDLKVFMQRNQSGQEFPRRISVEQFVQSEDLKQYKAELRTRQILESADVLDESDEDGMMIVHCPEDKVRKLLYQIATDNRETNQDEMAFLVESVKLPEVRQLVQEFLLGFTSPRCVQSRGCLVALSKTVLSLLDLLAKDVSSSHTDLYAIIVSSHNLFYFEGNRKCFLTSEIDKHKLWRDPEMWRMCVQKVVNFKFHEALKNLEKSKETEKASIGGFLNFSKIKGSIFGGAAKMEEVKKPAVISKALAQNIVFNNLSQFITHFVNFKLAFDLSRDLLMHFCTKYELDQSRTHLLLSELESLQISLQYVITSRDLQMMSKLKKEQRRDKYGCLLAVGLTLKFISQDGDLVKLLRLNRESYRRLQNNILKQALLLCQPERLQQKRVAIWRILMQIKENTSDYAAFKAKVMESPDLILNVEEVIMLDVQRSVHNMPGVDPQILVGVLKTYAFYNPEIEYCQGMNFIVGFLLMIFNDEETAFKVLQTLMERFHMADLFNTDLPKLKLFFFQLDRLVSIVDEGLHDHFIEEAVNSSYFASAWFITLFTNSLKQNQDEKHVVNENLLQIWDYFLIYGWQAILKMALYVLRQGRQELVQMSFEDILSDIVERPKSILTAARQDTQTMYQVLKKEFKNVPLSFHLERLSEEFRMSHNEVGKGVKKQQVK